MKKTLMAALLGTSLLFAGAQAFADSYIGTSFGATDADSDITNLTGTASLDEKDTGFKVFYGLKLGSSFAVELQYADLGELTLTSNSGNNTFEVGGTTDSFPNGDYRAIFESTSFGLSGVYNFVSEGTIIPFVKLGFHRWEVDASENIDFGFNTKTDGTDPFYGLGFDINVSENFAVRTEYESYELDDTDIAMASIGVTYSF